MAKEEGVIFGTDGSFWFFTFIGGRLQVSGQKHLMGDTFKQPPAASLLAKIKRGAKELASALANLKGNTIYIVSDGKETVACTVAGVYLRIA